VRTLNRDLLVPGTFRDIRILAAAEAQTLSGC
jgi:hypothetical protein